jgi:hypothetical protein
MEPSTLNVMIDDAKTDTPSKILLSTILDLFSTISFILSRSILQKRSGTSLKTLSTGLK